MAKFICHSLKNKLRKVFFKHHVLVSSENCNSFNKFQKLEKFYYFYKTNYEKKNSHYTNINIFTQVYNTDHYHNYKIPKYILLKYKNFRLINCKKITQGYNTCLVAYGSMETGKTHSLFGKVSSGRHRAVITRATEIILNRVFLSFTLLNVL